MEESRVAVNKFEKNVADIEGSEIADLRSELHANGKFIVDYEEGQNYIARVGSYQEPQYTAIGVSLSRKQAMVLANANYEEQVAYRDSGYEIIRSEQIDNAWVNVYTCTDSDGILWQRAVVKRGGYGDFIIDDDIGIIEGNLDSMNNERLYAKVRRYINGLNWK